jgi:hypothetical protein
VPTTRTIPPSPDRLQLGLCRRPLGDESGHERYANCNEDETAERFAPAFGEPAESVTEFESDQRKKHADGPDDDGGKHDWHRRRAKPETGCKVVDPQNEARNDQLSETEVRPQRFAAYGRSRRLPQRANADRDQKQSSDLMTRRAKQAAEAGTNEQTNERHRRLEETEHARDTQPKSTRDAGKSYSDRSPEVGESDREADDYDGERKW